MKLELSVIITTYNAPEWLEKVLIGYQYQDFKNFEVVIADDGSNEETKALIHRIQQKVDYPIIHVWHPDNGFQKTTILNKAILKATTDYLVFTDGDCIARKDFLSHHNTLKEEGYFLSGGYFKLPMNISKAITFDDIKTGRCFELSWLKKLGLKSSFKNNKLSANGLWADLLNSCTPTNASWNGHNASGWKKDILAINGYDTRLQYGGLDRELGERLFHLGIKSKQIRYTAICVHLDHKRGYKNAETLAKNKAIRDHNKKHKIIRTDFGITKL